ncbi:MAG: aldehyde dehydrogenase family protein, partial [Rhabdochlamydiaceae bacterium]
TIVTDKADVGRAVEGVLRGAFGYGGQKCSACSRVYVHEKVKDEFVKNLVRKTSELKVGDPFQRDTFLGPLINENAFNNYQAYVNDAKKSGVKIAYGGKVVQQELHGRPRGYFVEPTILVDVPRDHRLVKTELFVPLLTVESFKSFEDAIKMVNDVDYGLTSGIFSEDEDEIKQFFANTKAGVLYANRTSGSTTGAMVGVQTFVGWKKSGSTGKGTGGRYYLQQFLREQSQSVYD